MSGVEHQLIGLESVIEAMDQRDVKRALGRAMSVGARKGRKEYSGYIRDNLPAPARAVKAAITCRPPRNGENGLLTVVSPSTPLSLLKPRKTRKGFSVEIEKGRRVLIEGAFQFPSAGKRLFKRAGTFRLPKKGRYAGRGIKREDIEQLFTRSVTQAADDPAVINRVATVINETSRAEFVRQIKLLGGVS